MKVLLINPPLLSDERYGHLSKVGPVSEPLGLIYLGAALLKKYFNGFIALLSNLLK